MSKVLLVEDDINIREPLTRALVREGYEVSAHETGTSALQSLASADLLILDLGLPDMDGLDVARQARARGLTLPILILTARTEEVDMVVGLDAGADDYVTKPFRLAELMARVRALFRRTVAEDLPMPDLQWQDIRVDTAAHRAYKGEEELQLTSKEFDLLTMLMLNAGTVVSRETLMRKIWGTDPNSSSKTLDMHISWLRKKIGDEATHPHYISTVRGMGFRFEKQGRYSRGVSIGEL